MSNPRLVARLLEARFGARTDALVRLVGIGNVPYMEWFLTFCPPLSVMEHGKALLLASINGNVEAFLFLFNNCNKLLRQQAVGIYETQRRELVCQGTYTRALVFSCLHGHTSIVRILLESAFGPRADYHGGAPLLIATSYGHINIVRLILSAEHRPLQTADTADGACLSHVKRGIGVRADVYDGKALLLAVEHGHDNIVGSLLMHPTGPRADCRGGAALVLATKNGHSKIVRRLLAHPTAPLADCLGNIGLLLACEQGNVDIVLQILTHPTAPPADCCEGSTLMLAVMRGHYETVKVLLGFPEGPNGHADVARLLVDFSRGTETEGIAWCRNGAPMLYACRFGLPEVVHVLIEAMQPTNVTT
eukprot:gene29460-5806_t